MQRPGSSPAVTSAEFAPSAFDTTALASFEAPAFAAASPNVTPFHLNIALDTFLYHLPYRLVRHPLQTQPLKMRAPVSRPGFHFQTTIVLPPQQPMQHLRR